MAKAEQIVVRIDKKEREALEREAAAEGLDLSSYIRHLLHTHPKRTKPKR